MQGSDHHRFKKEGVTFLPASRLEEGLIAGMSIMEHFALQDSHGLLVRWNDAYQKAEEGIGRFQVKGRPATRVESLSGGNQQRLLLSFLPEHPVLLVLEHPTRGLDMESVRWVWEHLHNSCREKTSIFFSSAELDEIIMAADRVLVFFEGRVIKDVRTEETNSLELGMAIAGKI
jgi:simple sugar transport system ATP-binding protein